MQDYFHQQYVIYHRLYIHCKKTKLKKNKEIFLEHWSMVSAPKIFACFFRVGSNLDQLLQRLNLSHICMLYAIYNTKFLGEHWYAMLYKLCRNAFCDNARRLQCNFFAAEKTPRRKKINQIILEDWPMTSAPKIFSCFFLALGLYL